MIRSIALKSDGAAGPSGLDAAAWKRLCSSFKSAFDDLCDALASFARRICTHYVDPMGLSAFVACRLIALDKCPGVRPIGIGETTRRFIGKAIMNAISDNIQEAAGPLQVCAGHLSGCEAAVHAMRQVFQSPDTEATLLVDASNAFNSLNRQVALQNIHHLCPSISKALINTYRKDTQLFIDGETLLSQEGTTQGDPLAMVMYAIAITPLIHRLKDDRIKQVWFADDATAGGSLTHLKAWWDHIVQVGPEYGYFPNATKIWLIVKEELVDEAKALFQGSGVAITIKGKRHLGASIGTRTFVESYVQEKVSGWIHEVERLSSIALTQPHAAYAAFTHGLGLSQMLRICPNHSRKPSDKRLYHLSLAKNAFSDTNRELMALPVRLGGLGIIDPTKRTSTHYHQSERITAPLVALILQQCNTIQPETKAEQIRARNNARTICREHDSTSATEL